MYLRGVCMTLQRRFYTTTPTGSYTGPEPVSVDFSPKQIVQGRNAFGLLRKHTQIGFQTDLQYDLLSFKWKFSEFASLMRAASLGTQRSNNLPNSLCSDPERGVLVSPAFTDSAGEMLSHRINMLRRSSMVAPSASSLDATGWYHQRSSLPSC